MTGKVYIFARGEKEIEILDWEIFHDVLKGGGVGECLQLVCFAKLECH